MKQKIIRTCIFCVAVVLLIFLPAIINLGIEAYLNITMQNTGRSPIVETHEKLKKLVGENSYNEKGIRKKTKTKKERNTSNNFNSRSGVPI